MIWLNDITKLQYYNPAAGPCYCDQLIYPADLLLQGQVLNTTTIDLALHVYLYSADGLSNLGEITSYCSYYFAVNPATGFTFFNLRLNSFAPAMCAQACYILRVVAGIDGGATLFDSYTERYCQASCCDVPRGITVDQEGVSHRSGGGLGTGDTHEPIDPLPAKPDPCGENFITIRTTYMCYDAFSGDYYAAPTTGISGNVGTPFLFEKRLNLVAKIAQRERDIKREISYNCNVQRSESFKPYILQGISETALVPTWKMNEIEDMFHAEHIYVNDYSNPEQEYQFAGGKIFTQVHKCWEIFRLSATLQSCTLRQTFGCSTTCATSDKMYFVVPGAYNGMGFYGENRQLVAYTFSDLLQWAAGQNGVYEVTDLSSDYPGTAGAFSMAATGYIPTSFYYDATTPRNKIYGRMTPPDASAFVPACAWPVIGDVDVVTDACATPEYDTPEIITQADSQATIYNINNWDLAGVTNQVTIYNGKAVLSIMTVNTDFPATGSPLAPPLFGGEYIGIIGTAGRPGKNIFIDHAANENIPEGCIMTIDTGGRIGWYGPATNADSGGCKIEVDNVNYEL